MDVTYSTNAWGMVTAHCCGANNVNYAYYIATGEDKTAIKEIAEAGFESIEMFDGNLLAYEEKIDSLKELLEQVPAGSGQCIAPPILSTTRFWRKNTERSCARPGLRRN